MRKIPVFDLRSETDFLEEELIEKFKTVLHSGQFINGSNVKSFEQEVAEYLGVKYAIGVNSGTDALVIGLRAAGVTSGDEVITTPFTFFATAEAINQLGATPVFVDIDEQTYNIDVGKIKAVITSKTKAILPVHIYGQACNMNEILKIAKSNNLKVIEDVAQAFGGEYQQQKLGTIGDVGCFSFFPTKNLGTYGDGGLIATNDEKIAEFSKMLRVHGAKKKYHNEVFGYNSRLDELHAAILRTKLPYINDWNEARRRIANRYNEAFSTLDDVIVPIETEKVKHVYHQYTARILNGKREQLIEKLAELGVSTMVYYPTPVHKLPVYKDDHSILPSAEQFANEVISLPIWPMMEQEKQEYVIEAFIKAYNSI